MRMILLNPAPLSVLHVDTEALTQELKACTANNCRMRGDVEEAIKWRVASIDEELPIWRKLVEDYRAIEYVGWQFPEYRYSKEDPVCVLREARQELLSRCAALAAFFRENISAEK
ncbi:hypothetical protein H5T53_06930 [Candidatus Bipolaricaulota bacterium]|nr:hypothetical protein [Candidatus Bipolaricaulota bacterium]